MNDVHSRTYAVRCTYAPPPLLHLYPSPLSLPLTVTLTIYYVRSTELSICSIRSACCTCEVMDENPTRLGKRCGFGPFRRAGSKGSIYGAERTRRAAIVRSAKASSALARSSRPCASRIDSMNSVPTLSLSVLRTPPLRLFMPPYVPLLQAPYYQQLFVFVYHPRLVSSPSPPPHTYQGNTNANPSIGESHQKHALHTPYSPENPMCT